MAATIALTCTPTPGNNLHAALSQHSDIDSLMVLVTETPTPTPYSVDDDPEATLSATPTSSPSAVTTLTVCQPGDTSPMCQVGEQNPGQLLGNLLQFIFVIAVLLSLGFMIYGGIRWITSGGDKGGVENARRTLIAAIIGLIIVFLSFFLLNFVLEFLTGGSFNQLRIPNLTEH